MSNQENEEDLPWCLLVGRLGRGLAGTKCQSLVLRGKRALVLSGVRKLLGWYQHLGLCLVTC